MEEQRSLVLLGRACGLHKVMLRAFVPQACVVLVRDAMNGMAVVCSVSTHGLEMNRPCWVGEEASLFFFFLLHQYSKECLWSGPEGGIRNCSCRHNISLLKALALKTSIESR